MKNGILWLLIAAFLASVGFLFLANSRKDDALASLSDAKQQAADLQAQMAQLKSATSDFHDAEVSRLRAENQDLPRLRNQVTQLQEANRKLTDEFNSTLAALQQQQVQMQQLVTENQQAHAAVQQVSTTLQQADAQAARNQCINNLRQIDGAKNEWALENNKTVGAVPTAQDLLPYFKDQTFPICPSGGTYTIGAVGVSPTCSIPGHVLPSNAP